VPLRFSVLELRLPRVKLPAPAVILPGIWNRHVGRRRI